VKNFAVWTWCERCVDVVWTSCRHPSRTRPIFLSGNWPQAQCYCSTAAGPIYVFIDRPLGNGHAPK